MLVRDVMTKKVLTLSPSDSFSKAVKFLLKNKITGSPVVNTKGKIIGIISEKDLFHKLFPSEKKFYQDLEYYMNFENLEKEAVRVSRLKVRNLMSRRVIFVHPDDHILKACSLLLLNNIRRLPVIDRGQIVGIVTTNNIYKNFLVHLGNNITAKTQ